MERINHHNYETWLMLYLDHELTAPERQTVEAFMEANPELMEELNILKDVILAKDPLEPMPGKERFLMPEIWQEDAISPQQQQLLMLADNALPQKEKAELERQIQSSPLLQKEWALLQKTVVANEIPLSMPAKEKLYRYQRVRVIPFKQLYRIAAAAAIMAFGLFFALRMQQKNSSDEGKELATEQTVLPSLPNNLLFEDLNKSRTEKISADNEQVATKQTGAALKAALTKAAPANKEVKKASNSLNILMEDATEMPKKELKDLLANSSAMQTQPVEIGIAGVDAALPIQTQVQPELAIGKGFTESTKSETLIQAIEYNELEEDEEANINIAGAKISKQRVRGIYRSITRPLAKTFEKGNSKTYETK